MKHLAFLKKLVYFVKGIGLAAFLPAFAIFLIVATWYTTLSSLNHEREIIVKSVAKQVEDTVFAYEEHISRTIKQIDQAAKMIKYHFEYHPKTFNLYHITNYALVGLEAFVLISIADSEGKLIASTQDFRPVSIADREHFRVHQDYDSNSMFIGKPVLGRVSRKWTVQMSRRLNHLDGSFAGVIVLSVDPAQFTEFYDEKSGLGKYGTLGLLGLDGVYRAHRLGDTIYIGVSANQKMQQAARQSTYGGYYDLNETDHVNRFISYRLMRSYPLVIFAGVSEDEMLVKFQERQTKLIANSIGVSLLIALCFAIFTILVYRLKVAKVLSQKAEETYRAAMNGNRDAFLILSSLRDERTGRVIDLVVNDHNVSANSLFDLPSDHILGEQLSGLFGGVFRGRLLKKYAYVVETGEPFEEELRIDASSFRVKWLYQQVVRVNDGVALTARDISERKMTEEQLAYLATYDTLTGLPNRYYFQNRLALAVGECNRHCSSLALLFIDLDDFKTVNDCLGHDVGDLLLQEISLRLSKVAGKTGMVCRLGGDEFTIIMESIVSREVVEAATQRILHDLTEPYRLRGYTVSLSASIGICVYRGGKDTSANEDALLLVKSADLAMYRAKELGKNGYHFFTQSLSARMDDRLWIEQKLRSAIEHNELFLVYQPKFDLKTGKIVGYEALVRWVTSERGLIPPSEFISVAEATGLIVQLGQWVMRRVCQQISEWGEVAKDLPVAVNVSARQFRRGDFIDTLQQALLDFGVKPSSIELELTETIMVEDVDSALRLIAEITRLGISIAIDDFGTGYSSLYMLKRMAVNTLKIDRSFVADLAESSETSAIVEAIINMAHSLNINVVAEGVETLLQTQLLKRFNCDQVQGFLFSTPVLASAVPGLLKRNVDSLLHPKSNVVALIKGGAGSA